MTKYDEFGYDYETVAAGELQSGDIMIGHLGGISAVDCVYASDVMNGCTVVDTEHGSLYIDSDEPVVIMERDEPANKLASIKAKGDASSTVDCDDYVGTFGIYW